MGGSIVLRLRFLITSQDFASSLTLSQIKKINIGLTMAPLNLNGNCGLKMVKML
tara:strand:+ start:769 stop:930 length:162 start_codon:yes stop_codon:yes gene_type:complete